MKVDPAELFKGVVAITVPHMDDCALACGGTIARLPEKQRLHIIYATDGSGSPAPVLPWKDTVSPDLSRVRSDEAIAAMTFLGVPAENIHFLGLPDSRLNRYEAQLEESLVRLLARLRPTSVLAPFRYDRHSDHLALNRVVTGLAEREQVQLFEYFVYHRWRLLPGGDVRQFIQPQLLHWLEIEEVSGLKRAALERFVSQTTRYYPWQTRPNLTAALLDEVSREPECFLPYTSRWSGTAIFVSSVPWIRLVHRLEPFLKKRKDQVVAILKRGLRRDD